MQPTAQAVGYKHRRGTSPVGAKDQQPRGGSNFSTRASPAENHPTPTPTTLGANSSPSPPPPSSLHTSSSTLPNSSPPPYRAPKTPAPQSPHTTRSPSRQNSWDKFSPPTHEASSPSACQTNTPQSS